MTRHFALGLIAALLIGGAIATADAGDPLRELDAYLNQPNDRPPIEEEPFAHLPLDRSQAVAARQRLWHDLVATLQRERQAEWDAQTVVLGDRTMRLKRKTSGTMPQGGWSLFISMHGGGGTTAEVNDQQWSNQHNLYPVTDAIVIAPRAPTNNWNLWHESHIDPMLDRLISSAVVFDNVNRDRVYLVGYSAGGDGVYQLAPRMADRFAAAAMMAGHPNEAKPLGLRNLPFALHVGAEDAAYNRNTVAREWAQKLADLHQKDPQGYVHQVGIHEGLGHWMQLKEVGAIAWMQSFTRNPLPQRVVWYQDDVTHDRFYWLAVPQGTARKGDLVIAQRSGQTIQIVECNGVEKLTVLLNDQVVDLDEPVKIEFQQRTLFEGRVERTIASIATTLADRNDPGLVFDAAITVELPAGPASEEAQVSDDAVHAALAYLRANLPQRDSEQIDEAYLRENAKLALAARSAHAWVAAVPMELFNEYVLPYASLDETREPWRAKLQPIAQGIVADATSCGDAAVKLNNEIFATLGVQYHATKRPRPNQSIQESIAAGYASCTGLSIILVNACRSVGIPARVVGVADWVSPAGPTYTGNGNHTWVEIWDGRQWRFLGAIEKSELDQTWFFDKAKLADESRPLTAIHATAWTPTPASREHFPMVWASSDTTIPATNITRYYTKRQTVSIDAPAGTPADSQLIVRDQRTGRIAAAGTPGDFILAGGTTYEVITQHDGQSVNTRILTVP